jgi:hypothetical protein
MYNIIQHFNYVIIFIYLNSIEIEVKGNIEKGIRENIRFSTLSSVY